MADIRVLRGGKAPGEPVSEPPSQWFCMCVEDGWPHFTAWQKEPGGPFFCVCTRCMQPMDLPPDE